MNIIINGKSEDVEKEMTISKLLKHKNIDRPELVVVELNNEVLKKSSYEKITLRENDAIELIYFMGGGR